MVMKFEQDNSGIQAARSFLQKYRRADHMSLPEGLWTELDSIAAHAEGAGSGMEAMVASTSTLHSSPRPKSTSGGSPCTIATPTASRQRQGSETDSVITTKESPQDDKKRSLATLTFSSSKRRKQ